MLNGVHGMIRKVRANREPYNSDTGYLREKEKELEDEASGSVGGSQRVPGRAGGAQGHLRSGVGGRAGQT